MTVVIQMCSGSLVATSRKHDNNNINEKSVVGFLAFAIMVIFAFADLLTGYLGKDLVINEFIYDSFVWIVLGAFGIAEVGKVFGKKQ